MRSLIDSLYLRSILFIAITTGISSAAISTRSIKRGLKGGFLAEVTTTSTSKLAATVCSALRFLFQRTRELLRGFLRCMSPSSVVCRSVSKSTTSPGAKGLYALSSCRNIFPFRRHKYDVPSTTTVKILFAPKATLPVSILTGVRSTPVRTYLKTGDNAHFRESLNRCRLQIVDWSLFCYLHWSWC